MRIAVSSGAAPATSDVIESDTWLRSCVIDPSIAWRAAEHPAKQRRRSHDLASVVRCVPERLRFGNRLFCARDAESSRYASQSVSRGRRPNSEGSDHDIVPAALIFGFF